MLKSPSVPSSRVDGETGAPLASLASRRFPVKMKAGEKNPPHPPLLNPCLTHDDGLVPRTASVCGWRLCGQAERRTRPWISRSGLPRLVRHPEGFRQAELRGGIITPGLSTPYRPIQAGHDLRGPCESFEGGVEATSLASVQGPYSRLAMAGVRGSEVVGFLAIPGRSGRSRGPKSWGSGAQVDGLISK